MSALRAEAGWRWRLPFALPFIDAGAALTAGLIVLLLREWLAGLYAFPLGLVTFLGGVNVAYSVIGLSLGLRRSRPHLAVLIAANLLWGLACAVLVVRFAGVGSAIGLAMLVFEGLFVSALAALEWRYRAVIVSTR